MPCVPGSPLFALRTYSHFQARRCARSSPDHGPGAVCSKSQTSEIPATKCPRSGRAEPRQSPPPEAACSRGFRRTAKYPLVLARVDHPRNQNGFRFFFFFLFSFSLVALAGRRGFTGPGESNRSCGEQGIGTVGLVSGGT